MGLPGLRPDQKSNQATTVFKIGTAKPRLTTCRLR
jgi:hypothetical protein